MHPVSANRVAAVFLYRTHQTQAGAAMGKLTEQHGPVFAPITRRQSATREDLAARQTQAYPPASPHRVGHTPGLHGEDAPYVSEEVRRPARRHTIEAEDEEPPSAYADSPRRSKTTVVWTPVSPTVRLRRTCFHWLVFVGLAMFIMILGWLTFSALSGWWSVQLDDWHYGRVRRFGGS